MRCGAVRFSRGQKTYGAFFLLVNRAEPHQTDRKKCTVKNPDLSPVCCCFLRLQNYRRPACRRGLDLRPNKATAKASPTPPTHHRPHRLIRIYCENKQNATAKASTTPAPYHRPDCLTRTAARTNKKRQQKHHQQQLTLDRTA